MAQLLGMADLSKICTLPISPLIYFVGASLNISGKLRLNESTDVAVELGLKKKEHLDFDRPALFF